MTSTSYVDVDIPKDLINRSWNGRLKELMRVVAPDIAAALKLCFWKRMDFWHPIL